ncbi:MAG: DedA family protein [Bdellovibrionales bacterium]|nr:DedA family protein [Bdellovibrionales bacterium]
MLHSLVLLWFSWVRDGGYLGVFFLMALESTIVPIPSELILPPAAFWAAQGHMSFWGVVAAGTLGSYAGSAVSYLACRWLGGRFLHQYGRYVLLTDEKITMAERLVRDHGAFGIFVSRMLPVVRHLISMPAGVFKMDFKIFSLVTLSGAGIWCYILALWGQKILGAHPELLNSPEQMMSAVKSEMIWFVAGIAGLALLYSLVVFYKKSLRK